MFRSLALSLNVTILLVAAAGAQQVNNTQQDAQATKPAQLKIGDEAPDWEMVGTNGKKYKLSSFKGKKAVVVAWYPAALTGG